VKSLITTIAASGAIALVLAAPAKSEAAQVHVAVNLGVPVVTHHVGYRSWGGYQSHHRHYRHRHYYSGHRHGYGHRHRHYYANDHRWHQRPIHNGHVYGRPPAIKRIEVNPRLQRR